MNSNETGNTQATRKLYGLSCSYFTGKLEAYFLMQVETISKLKPSTS